MGKQYPNLAKAPLTKEEEADEIMRRLAAPPVRRPRTITANWTVETMEDLGGHFGIDLEAEINEALSASIAEEIDNEMLKEMRRWKM